MLDLPIELLQELIFIIDDYNTLINILCTNTIFLEILSGRDIETIKFNYSTILELDNSVWRELPNGTRHWLYIIEEHDVVKNLYEYMHDPTSLLDYDETDDDYTAKKYELCGNRDYRFGKLFSIGGQPIVPWSIHIPN